MHLDQRWIGGAPRALLPNSWRWPFVVAFLFIATAAHAGPRVAVTIKPLHSLVSAVMTGVAKPHLIVRGAGSPHAYALKPSDAAALNAADLVFWVGPELETFLIKPLAGLDGKTRAVALMKAPGVDVLETRTGLDWSGAGQPRANAAHAAHDHPAQNDDPAHAHLHGDDPHVWLDPRNAAAMANAVAGRLAEIDPSNAALYAENRDRLVQSLAALETRLAERLAPVRGKPFLVYHDAYAYFERRFGLQATAAISRTEGRAPGARRVARLRRLITEKDIRCVFVEPQFEPRLARVIIEGTKARLAELDPLAAARPAGPDLYVELIEAMAGAMLGCLGQD